MPTGDSPILHLEISFPWRESTFSQVFTGRNWPFLFIILLLVPHKLSEGHYVGREWRFSGVCSICCTVTFPPRFKKEVCFIDLLFKCFVCWNWLTFPVSDRKRKYFLNFKFRSPTVTWQRRSQMTCSCVLGRLLKFLSTYQNLSHAWGLSVWGEV